LYYTEVAFLPRNHEWECNAQFQGHGRYKGGVVHKRVLIVASILLIGWVGLYAQSERGSIRGTVQDASGAVVAGAKVTATNLGTGVETSTNTTEAGNYNIPQLPPGEYTVTA
jgi:Carboxypeptidase regulatory-like domain